MLSTACGGLKLCSESGNGSLGQDLAVNRRDRYGSYRCAFGILCREEQ